MAQFDVHRNAGRQRQDYPFVVVVQSAQFDDFPRRVVVPLARFARAAAQRHPDLTPEILVEREVLYLDPLQLQSMPRDALGPAIASLAQDSDRITKAIDAVITRAWG